MVAEEFSSGNSLFHDLDPRIKIIVASLFSTIVAIADRTEVLLLALLFSVFCVILSSLSMGKLIRRLFLVNGFILVLWVVLPFTYPGKTLFSVGPLDATAEGIRYACSITIKSNAIILACIALLGTTPIFKLAHALRHLYVPDKLVQLLFFSYRYIHVIYLEYVRLVNAMKVRCFHPRSDLHTYKAYGHLVGMVVLKSYDCSERVHDAMLCRGFKGKFWVLDHFSLERRDLIAFIIMLLSITGLGFLQWGKGLFS
ncbi:MAG: cobalt ECF transporter T component CbiQ [Syntrophobacterales bacterium]|nr:MAG: cobalt ECF transporter T component CbiQ [Syntrophobacterales bacterium]